MEWTDREKLLRAYAWVELNPECWLKIKGYAAFDYNLGNRISIKRYAEMVRNSATGVDDYAINNYIVSALARILIEEHPEYRDSIKMRRTGMDIFYFVDPEAEEALKILKGSAHTHVEILRRKAAA